jgi:predicted DNA-binding protein (MmcQ/YjbR family)
MSQVVLEAWLRPRATCPGSNPTARLFLEAMAELNLTAPTAALKAVLDAMPGAAAVPFVPPRATTPLVLMYKVMGKTFAILQVRGFQNVIVKCDPHLAEVLREQYAGVGRRSHLDPRHWICIDLEADVPAAEIERLAAGSYALVCAGLTRKQKAELAAIQVGAQA